MKPNRTLLIRIGIGAAALMAATLIGAMIFAAHLRKRGLPDYDRDIALEGLIDEVAVYRDRHGTPHIYAKNEHDLYLATGYCMAGERLWQMDLIRRVTQGRLSEIFGEEMVEIDLLLRALGIEKKSREIMGKSDPALIAVGEAFSRGVNLYLRDHAENLPPEFFILGYEPEKWEPVHSVNLIGYMAWDLTMPWGIETVMDEVKRKVGDGLFEEIVPRIEKTESAIYGLGEVLGPEAPYARSLLEETKLLGDRGLAVFNASNNWAVSGSRSVTGKPLLSNDMHLGLSAPGIWMQIHQCIEGKDSAKPLLDVTGVAVPGQPFVISGHNEDIAWGLTNVMIDDMDFFVEKTDPANPNRYLYNGQWRDMDVRVESIAVKGGTVEERKIRRTVHGPVVSEFKKIKDAVVTMHWAGNYFSNELATMYRLNRARNFDEFRAALRTFTSLSQNVAYADVRGNIGIVCAAGIPIRKKGDGMSLVPGWTDEYEWSGFVPFEQQPYLYNPPSGMVLSANNRTSTSFSRYISRWYYPPHRYDRIREMLLSREKHSIEDFTAMHGDMKSALAARMRPGIVAVIEKMEDPSDVERRSLERLRGWDGTMDAGSPAAAIFEHFYVSLLRNIFLDEMGQEVFEKYTGNRVTVAYAIDQLWATPGSPWFDDVTTDARETFDDTIMKSFRDAVSLLERRYSGNTREWRWGRMHTLTLSHPLGSIRILDLLLGLNRGPFKVGGSYHTVCPYSYKLGKPFSVTEGASQRHAYDLADWDNSYTVIPTGNSGIPGSPHYCDQTRLYIGGTHHPDHFSKAKVTENAAHTMKFVRR